MNNPKFGGTAKKSGLPISRLPTLASARKPFGPTQTPMQVSGLKRPFDAPSSIQASSSKFRRTTPLSLLKRQQPRIENEVPVESAERLDFSGDQFRTPLPVKKTIATEIPTQSRIPMVRKPLEERPPETLSLVEPRTTATLDTKSTSPMVDWNTITRETEIISYKVKINRLQKEIDELKCANSKLRINHEVNENRLKTEIEDKQNKIKELQREIDTLKQEEEKRKIEFEEFQKVHFEQSNYVDKQKVEFENAIAELKDELRQIREENGHIQSKASMDALNYQHQINQLQSENDLLRQENQICASNTELLESKEREIQSLRQQLQQANETIEELRNEIKSYQEGKKLEAILQGEMSQLKVLKDENRLLKNRNDLLGKVHEENVILKEKLLGSKKTIKMLNEQLNEKNVDIHDLQNCREKLNRWIQIVGIDSPEIVSDKIHQLKERADLFSVENEILKSEIKTLKTNSLNVSQESQSYQTEVNNARNKIKQLEEALEQANQKCLFLAKESELYKTMAHSLESSNVKDEQMATRFQELESMIQQYKQIISRLETELKNAVEQLEKKKLQENENEALRNELQRIKELNPHICTNNSLDVSTLQTKETNFRVIHLKDNLLQEEINKRNEEFNELKKENQRLKCMVETLGKSDQADITRQIDEALEYRFQVESLKEQLAKKTKGYQDLKTVFKKATDTYRLACRELTGYQIDNIVRNRYRIRTKFAKNDEILVEIDDRSIRLLENATTVKVQDKIDRYLKTSGNYPAFFASYILDLIRQRSEDSL